MAPAFTFPWRSAGRIAFDEPASLGFTRLRRDWTFSLVQDVLKILMITCRLCCLVLRCGPAMACLLASDINFLRSMADGV